MGLTVSEMHDMPLDTWMDLYIIHLQRLVNQLPSESKVLKKAGQKDIDSFYV